MQFNQYASSSGNSLTKGEPTRYSRGADVIVVRQWAHKIAGKSVTSPAILCAHRRPVTTSTTQPRLHRLASP